MACLLTQSCENHQSHFSSNKFLLKVFILVTCIKVLLIPTYHSTDFEVHRNWLAITHSTSIDEWYTSAKSPWTLDYPPLFAWFEYFLSKAAVFFDSEMLKIDNFDYASTNTKLFQRTTVMMADLFFLYGIKEVGQVFCKSHRSFVAATVLSLCNIGLLVVDHVHFQYNGFLLGVLLMSLAKVSRISSETNVLQGAIWFAILLNLKHLYLYVAPAYLVWLLRSYCLRNRFIYRFFKLGALVIFIFSLSFGPFIHQIPQVLARLFPFKRGLVHAYWAANAWALYIAADKLLSVIWQKIGWLNNIKVASMTGGLVQEDSLTILPTPTPLATFIITFILIMPALWVLFFVKKNGSDAKSFVRCIVICGLTSFMFSWHVHEKAILTSVIPLGILAAIDEDDAKIFILLSSAGHAALFPLLYPAYLTPLKLLLWFAYLTVTLILFKKNFGEKKIMSKHEWMYIALVPVNTIYETILHKIIFGDKMPFLPLALTSVFCALGITYSYVIYYYKYVFQDNNNESNESRQRSTSKKAAL